MENRIRNQIDDDELIELYCNQFKSISEISIIIDCYAEKISKRLDALSIQKRKPNDTIYCNNRKKNKEPCVICGKEPTQEYMNTGQFYCSRHYTQMLRDGEIKERTKFDPNEIHIFELYFIIDLYNSKNIKNGEAFGDLEDLELIKGHKWRKDRQGYVATNIEDEFGVDHRVSMHRLIMSPKEYELVDHINFNKSDNRKDNLRLVNKSQNEMHKMIGSNNNSGTRGVSYYKGKNLWVAEIVVSGKKVFRKGYRLKEDAIKAREEAEKRYFKEYSPLLK